VERTFLGTETFSAVLRWQRPIQMKYPKRHRSTMLYSRVRMEAGGIGGGEEEGRTHSAGPVGRHTARSMARGKSKPF
jgi:hypothetical protein